VICRVPSNHGTDYYFCMMPPIQNDMSIKRKQHLCIQIYHQHFGLCLMAMHFLFLNLRTILLCALTTKTVFLQTAKNKSSTLRVADNLPSTDFSNHKITEGELIDLIRDLKLPKRMQNF